MLDDVSHRKKFPLVFQPWTRYSRAGNTCTYIVGAGLVPALGNTCTYIVGTGLVPALDNKSTYIGAGLVPALGIVPLLSCRERTI